MNIADDFDAIQRRMHDINYEEEKARVVDVKTRMLETISNERFIIAPVLSNSIAHPGTVDGVDLEQMAPGALFVDWDGVQQRLYTEVSSLSLDFNITQAIKEAEERFYLTYHEYFGKLYAAT